MACLLRGALRGAAAGAAGTTALNGVTYLDMALRGRPGSDTPEETVRALSDKTGIKVPGEGERHENRISGLGPLTGLAAGIGTGTLLGIVAAAGWRPGTAATAMLATAGAMVGSSGPMAALGITDPREWPVSSWISDLVPHAAYGAVTAAVLHGLDR
ncbi:hypothetical protein [Actinomadura verrucosospora]|uniref:Uncharacterized protein n=1 Tax=Actinomadura verrucosospora TaxID=46165 RepID=A0A7D4AIV8_ACTVE|nr:hypothetical protein [Actinomadura verrucosospora]QKG19808.1 hypothetical protein ACTIVE_1444 [Actinomadura verrucosospora]